MKTSLRAGAYPEGIFDSGGVVVDTRTGAISYINAKDRRGRRDAFWLLRSRTML